MAEDIINYETTDASYAFLIEQSQAITIHHPSFSRPSQHTTEHLMHTDIEHLEQRPEFKAEVKALILSSPKGNHTIQLNDRTGTNLTYI